ncbi:MAG: amidase family protein [Xylophilus ampelinus]
MAVEARERDYVQADATALAAAVERGAVAPRTLLEIAIGRARRLQPAFGAFSQFGEDLARAQLAAMESPGTGPRGPFHGVPFAVKDLGAPLAGLPTRAGSRALGPGTPPDPRDGALVARLRAAGFVPFGKTTVPEFGLDLASEPAAGPVCRNPWAPGYGAGGSSGGAAAAVAAGIVPVAHATDAGGSIRIPAAACGLVGLKPGRGTVPCGPDYGNVFGGLASEFVLSRSVRDSAAVWRWIARGAPSGGPGAPLRIGLLLEAPRGAEVEAPWREAAAHAAGALRAAGHALRPVDPARLRPACDDAALAFRTFACRAAAAAADALRPAEADLEPATWAAARRGRALSARDHLDAEIATARCTDDLSTFFHAQGFDALLTPSLAAALPAVGALRGDGDFDRHLARFDRYAPFAAVANASGCPAIAVPHGRDASGRPLSVQLMGPPGAEDLLLGLAVWLEARHPWQRLPDDLP